MLFYVVHAAGSAIYFVFFFLLLLASRVPRTNLGCGWWALAIFLACIARVSFSWMQADDAAIAKLLYALLTLAEKLALLIGVIKFFNVEVKLRTVLSMVGVMQLWVLSAHFFQYGSSVYSIGLALCNAICLGMVSWFVWNSTVTIPRISKVAIVTASSLMVLLWLIFVPVSRYLYADWRTMSFVAGTFVMVLLYTSLISAVFVLFQKRLLDSEMKALDLAYKDPLTGLSNKRYIDALFGQALQLANRPHQLLALYYIDLDKFKPVNDEAGHKAGDQVLKNVAERLTKAIRSTDICARLGGDEFVVIATQLESDEQAELIATKLLSCLNEDHEVNNRRYQVGASIGVSLYPHHGATFMKLLERADEAMYVMKKEGRGGYRMAIPDAPTDTP